MARFSSQENMLPEAQPWDNIFLLLCTQTPIDYFVLISEIHCPRITPNIFAKKAMEITRAMVWVMKIHKNAWRGELGALRDKGPFYGNFGGQRLLFWSVRYDY